MNTGKELEILVKEIEEILLPKGFNVELNKKVFEDGIQSDEFDILISGLLGSSSISWLIECRDRPSRGAQPKEWIEQLIGRKESNKFNKVTAVSTTGFSPKAISVAKLGGIDLHVVTHIKSGDIISWWNQTALPLIENSGNLSGTELYFDFSTNIDLLERTKSIFQNINAEDKILKCTKDGCTYSILNAWKSVLNQNPQIFEGLTPESQKREIVLQAHYSNPDDRYQVDVDNRLLDLIQINFHAELKVNQRFVDVNKVMQVGNPIEKKTIDQLVNYEFSIVDQDISLTMHKFSDSKDIVISFKSKPKF